MPIALPQFGGKERERKKNIPRNVCDRSTLAALSFSLSVRFFAPRAFSQGNRDARRAERANSRVAESLRAEYSEITKTVFANTGARRMHARDNARGNHRHDSSPTGGRKNRDFQTAVRNTAILCGNYRMRTFLFLRKLTILFSLVMSERGLLHEKRLFFVFLTVLQSLQLS